MRHIRFCLRVQGSPHLRTAVAALLLSGCVVGKVASVGTDSGLNSGSDTSNPGGGAGTSFAQIHEEVLFPSCGFASCHGSGVGGLTIAADTTASDLINVAAMGMPDKMYVVPGDPDNSYLVMKMENTPGISGGVMPTTGVLDPDRVDTIRAWIAAGAH